MSAELTRQHGSSVATGRMLLQLNRELAVAQLVPAAFQADGRPGSSQLWLIPAASQVEAEKALLAQRRWLRQQEATRATTRGVPEEVVHKVRDQVNHMLQRFSASLEHGCQQREVEIWRRSMARAACRTTLVVALGEPRLRRGLLPSGGERGGWQLGC